MWFRRRPDPDARLAALEADVGLLTRSVAALREDLGAWEARAVKLNRELSRTLKSLAEVERRDQLRLAKLDDPDQLDLEAEDMVTRTLRFARGG